eukprot:Nk52_evm1s2086 gene=Nk52_evmTU1s2086
MKTVSGRLARWTLLLAEYDFDIEYIQGRAQEIADYLSRDAIINDLEPKSMIKQLDIISYFSKPYVARSHGKIERAHKEINEQLR